MPVDGAEGCLRAFVQLKQQYSKMRVILSVGGGGKGSENFAAVANSRSKVDTFVRTARGLVDQFGIDGIDSKTALSFGFLLKLETHHSLYLLYSRLGASL